MVDNECIPDKYKSLKISIGSIIKNPERLRFLPDLLEAKNMCKHAVKSCCS